MNRVLRYSSLPLIWYLLSIGTIATTTSPVIAQPDRSSQLAQADVVRVTDVRVEQTATGVNLIFTTADGAALSQPVSTTSVGVPTVGNRTFIAEFANTTLTLPQGQTFQAKAPAPGIELVTVEVIASNRVQVKIVGKNEVPVANIQVNPNGLLLAISSPAEPEELEITVIATRSAENLRNVPQSITKIDRQQIQKQIAVSRDLGDAFGRHIGLIEKDPAEMVAVGENLVLMRQVCAAAIDQVDARQPVRLGNLLRAQMLFDGHRVISAALYRRVVAHDHALATRHPPNTADDTSAGDFAVVKVVCRKLADLQKRRTRIKQTLHPLTWQQLTPRGMPFARLLVTAKRRLRDLRPQFIPQRDIVRKVQTVILAFAISGGGQNGCGHNRTITRKPLLGIRNFIASCCNRHHAGESQRPAIQRSAAVLVRKA